MDSCDALIVGGGPAGLTCAWKLRQAGLDVVVVDRAVFPRDKVCAGWITPQVVSALELDISDYRRGRTFQPITGFQVGVVGGGKETRTTYGHAVSFGIRRCEFDHYLLCRSGARVHAGMPASSIRRAGGQWILNEAIQAPVLIGAGGQFCPVARMLNGQASSAALVVAQEAEFPIDAVAVTPAAVQAEAPELYFCRDMKGYGWCFRKGDYLNVGLGRLDHQSLPKATAQFVAFLADRGKLPQSLPRRWAGHAYSVYQRPHRRIADAGVMLVGDAAGLAYPESGEGIGPAIESGALAAATIVTANGHYTSERLEPYERRLRARFGTSSLADALSAMVPPRLGTAMARRLLGLPAFVRHVVLDRWFLHRTPSTFLRGAQP